MKNLFLWASGTLAVVPGLVTLQSGVGSPPGMKVLLGGGVEAFGSLALLFLWSNRERLSAMRKARVTSLGIALASLCLLCLIVYTALLTFCVVETTKPEHKDFGPVFFPLWLVDPIASAVNAKGSRVAAVNEFGPGGMVDALNEMHGITWARIVTQTVFFLLYQAIFTSLTIAFGLVGLHAEPPTELPASPKVSGPVLVGGSLPLNKTPPNRGDLRAAGTGKLIDPALLGNEYRSLDDVVNGLTILEQTFRELMDRRGVFVTAYILITREIKQRIAAGKFRDGAWVARYAVAFANLYRIALFHYERGELEAVPKAWRFSFDSSKSDEALVIQDLILGINAHINHDLALALNQVSIDPERAAKYEDHTAVNNALNTAIPPVRSRVEELYAPGLGMFDPLLGPLEQELTSFSFAKARENAWTQGVALANAANEGERAAMEDVIDERAGVMARLILAPATVNPQLLQVLRHLEQLRPWPTYLNGADIVSTLPDAVVYDLADIVPTLPDVVVPPSAPPPQTVSTGDGVGSVQTLQDVIDKLGEVISRFDSQRNRLSIYPTVYRRITEKVKAGVEQGAFLDPNWMTKLDVCFANRYFRTLEDNAAQRKVPDCWAIPFEAVRTGQTIIIQDIILQINARVNYDLPLALVDAGLDRDLDKRRQDYETTYRFFMEEFDAIKDLLALKYTRLLKVEMLDLILGRLEAELANKEYIHARDEAWKNALGFNNHPSEANRQAFIERLDRKATAFAKNVLVRNIAPVTWITRLLRHLEDRFPGSWSDLAQNGSG